MRSVATTTTVFAILATVLLIGQLAQASITADPFQRRDIFLILGADHTMSKAEIKSAYLKTLMRYHTDRSVISDVNLSNAEASRALRAITRAWEYLSDGKNLQTARMGLLNVAAIIDDDQVTRQKINFPDIDFSEFQVYQQKQIAWLKGKENWTNEDWRNYFDLHYQTATLLAPPGTADTFLRGLTGFIGGLENSARNVSYIQPVFTTAAIQWVKDKIANSPYTFSYGESGNMIPFMVTRTEAASFLEVAVKKIADPDSFIKVAAQVISATWAAAPSAPYSRIEDRIQTLLLPLAHTHGIKVTTADELLDLAFEHAMGMKNSHFIQDITKAYLKLLEAKPTWKRIQMLTSVDDYVYGRFLSSAHLSFRTLVAAHPEFAPEAGGLDLWQLLYRGKSAIGPRTDAEWAADFRKAIPLRGKELHTYLWEIAKKAKTDSPNEYAGFRETGGGVNYEFQRAIMSFIQSDVLAVKEPLTAKEWAVWLKFVTFDPEGRVFFRTALPKIEDPTELLRFTYIMLVEEYWRSTESAIGHQFLDFDIRNGEYLPELHLILNLARERYNHLHGSNLSKHELASLLIQTTFTAGMTPQYSEREAQEVLIDYLESMPTAESIQILKGIVNMPVTGGINYHERLARLANEAIVRMEWSFKAALPTSFEVAGEDAGNCNSELL